MTFGPKWQNKTQEFSTSLGDLPSTILSVLHRLPKRSSLPSTAKRIGKEVAAWRERSRDAHDWSPYFRFVVQRLEGKGSEEALIREAELRKKITHILSCDIAVDDPVKWPSTWTSHLGSFDVVTTSFCIEAAVKSVIEYRNAIAKLRKYLKPGGYLVMRSSIGETLYTVGKEIKVPLLFREREANPRSITPGGLL